MSIKKEWKCMAHGFFEGVKPICPKGCTTVERAFVTPTSIKTSDRTKNIDRTLEQLAKDYKLTDINNQNGTAAVKRPDSKAVNQMEALNQAIEQKFGVGMGGGWGQMAQGGVFNAANRQVEGGGSGTGAIGAMQRYGNAPTTDLTSIKQELPDWRKNVIVHAKDTSKLPE